jgi:hypothetical protein
VWVYVEYVKYVKYGVDYDTVAVVRKAQLAGIMVVVVRSSFR